MKQQTLEALVDLKRCLDQGLDLHDAATRVLDSVGMATPASSGPTTSPPLSVWSDERCLVSAHSSDDATAVVVEELGVDVSDWPCGPWRRVADDERVLINVEGVGEVKLTPPQWIARKGRRLLGFVDY